MSDENTKEFHKVSELAKYCDRNATTIVVGMCFDSHWVKVYKNDFFRNMSEGDFFANYDGEESPVTVYTDQNVAYVKSSTGCSHVDPR